MRYAAATGARVSARAFSMAAAKRKTPKDTPARAVMSAGPSRPAGRWRSAVLGFRASM